MELNALTRWESIGKDLYRTGEVGQEIARLKARSKHVAQQRSDEHAKREAYDESLDGSATPTPLRGSRNELAALEREEREFLDKWRALRDKGKKLRIEEESLEQSTVPPENTLDLSDPLRRPQIVDAFPAGHQQWVYFSYRLLRRFAKGFLFGYCGKFAFASIGLVMRHKFNLLQLAPALATLTLKKELWQYGAFLGSFLTIFESSIRLLKMKSWLGRKAIVRHHRSVRVILSAAVAAGAAMSFLPEDTRLGISMFFAVRALEILVRWCVEREEVDYAARSSNIPDERARELQLAQPSLDAHKVGAIALAEAAKQEQSSMTLPPDEPDSLYQRIRRPLKSLVLRVAALPVSQHFDTATMAIASSQVIWAWLFNRHTVEPSYLRFLDIQGGRTKAVQHGYVQLHYGHGPSMEQCNLDAINAARGSRGEGPLDMTMPLPDLMCCVIHGSQSCTAQTAEFFRKGILRALPVYLPVYVIPMLLFKHRQLLRKPLQILLPTAINTLRSSVFLSSYCTVCWAVACATTNLGLTHNVKGALAGFSGGLMVAMEKKGRRIELALYVLSQALPSTWRTLVQWGVVRNVPHGESLVFVASMAVILWSYVTRPHLMRSSYLSLFLWFFGSGGRAAGFSLRALEHSTPKSTTAVDRAAAIEDAGKGEVAGAHRLVHETEADALPASSSSSSGSSGLMVAASSASPPALSSAPDASASLLAPASAASSSSSSSPPASSPGALVMQARHSSRLSTVQDEVDEEAEAAAGEGSPNVSPAPFRRAGGGR